MIAIQGITGIRSVIVSLGYTDIYLNNDTDYVPSTKGKMSDVGFIVYDLGEKTRIFIHTRI